MSQHQSHTNASHSSHARTHCPGGAHLGMTVLTAGLWLPVWVGTAIWNRVKTTPATK